MRPWRVWVLLVCLMQPASATADEWVLKFATLAPDGSSWIRLGRKWIDAMDQHSGGRLHVKLITGGAAGDERAVVHKIRMRHLSGAAVTTVGLGLIENDLLVLQHPLLVRNVEELDFVRARLAGQIRRKFLERDFVLLAWADVGEVHIFSKSPIRTRTDLAHARVWAWVDDPVSRKLVQAFGVQGVPLGVPDVLPSLASGLIDVCYGSPLSMVAMQWHSRVRYMTSQAVMEAAGAIVIAKRDFDALPQDLQQILLSDSRAFEEKLMKQTRDDNARSLAAMKRRGLEVVDVSPQLMQEFQAAAEKIRGQLDGAVYGREFRAQVDQLLAQYRAGTR